MRQRVRLLARSRRQISMSQSSQAVQRKPTTNHLDQELPPPSIEAQFQAARRGHSLSTISVGRSAPPEVHGSQAALIHTGGLAIQCQSSKNQQNSANALSEQQGNVGRFSDDELNDAIKTVYGELTATVHGDTQKEARAIASTIFNRLLNIERSRKNHAALKAKLKGVQNARDNAIKRYEDLTKNPSKYKLEMGGDAYLEECDKAKKEYKRATSALNSLQIKIVQAKSELDGHEKGTIDNSKIGRPITLSDIVAQNGQYEGTKKGISDFNEFPKMNKSDQARHRKRYEAAKNAVLDLAKDPTKADGYTSFVGGDLRPNGAKDGEVQIGGNYFKK